MTDSSVARKGGDVASELKQLADDTNAKVTAASTTLKKLQKRGEEVKERLV